MDTTLVDKITNKYKEVKHPEFSVGDIIEVHTKIKEGGKERIQVFKGIVIAIKGADISKTFTIRKISYGVGVEKIYPLYSPVIAKIKVIKRGKVKRSKLYFLRKRVGKSALKAGIQIPAEGEDLETKFEEEVKQKAEEEKKIESEKKKSEEKKVQARTPEPATKEDKE